ncbi:MAG: ASCH domain-containing protein [Ruminococcaceae bacterium]|nr:ASCH domain-containing protein [Oscillospiraceae bacterium]
MNAETMWKQYTAQSGACGPYDAWQFGDDANRLAQLVLDGVKTGTSSAYPIYAAENEPLPEENTYSVVLWEDNTAACIIKTTKVYVIPFCQVSARHAFAEGEGDRSLSYWRNVHRSFFTKELADAGLDFTEDMQVVCEEFIKVFP